MKDEKTSESPTYSPEQQKTIRQGLRVLAKVAIRAHLRRQASVHRAAQAPTPTQEDSS